MARVLLGLTLLAAAGFCVYGFLASFEPPGYPAFKIGYVVIGLLCLTGGARVLVRRGGE